MKVVVTGGAGFVGVHVVEELHHRGLGEIVVLDSCRNTSALHLAKLDGKARLIEFDLLSGGLDETFRSLQADTLIHLAGVHQASWCETHRAETFRTNVEILERLLAAAVSSGVRRIFAASSSAVYAPLDRPYREDDRVEPPDFYGLTKAINEQQIRLWSAKSPYTHFALGRLFNVVGGFETSPRLAPEVVRRALRGGPIVIGNLKPRRDYVHVKDVARAIVTMVLDNRDPLDICNIGTGIHWSVEDLIGAVGKIVGRPISFKSSPELIRSDERMLIAAELARITRRYDWRPRYSLEDALREAVAFARRGAE